MNPSDAVMMAAPAAKGLTGGLQVAVITVIWILAAGLAIWKYTTSKGRIGSALMVGLGGGIIATLIVTPAIITTTIPAIFNKVVTWAASAFN